MSSECFLSCFLHGKKKKKKDNWDFNCDINLTSDLKKEKNCKIQAKNSKELRNTS